MIDRISRRSMLTGAVAAGAASLASSVVSAAPATKWDETVDVIVIGSGFAGLAAAIEAKKAGANVVVLEKMPTAGGNSIINGGILTATGCPQQKKAGIEDSFDLLEKDILVAGNYMNDKAKVHLLAQSALSNFEWTVKELGVEYLPDAIGQEGGHSVPRYVTTKNGSGSGIVQKELDKCKELGIPIRLRTYVQNIIRTEKGVEGVRVREGYRFPNEGSGKEKTIRATKGVVLCYGGFSADVKFRMFQDPKLDGSLDTTNQPGATSELWRETMAIGCLQVQDDWIQCGPWTSPREKGMGIGWQFSQTAAAEYGLWVNSDGKRFVNELANRKVRADAIMVEQTNGHRAVAICTQNNLNAYKVARPGTLEKLLEQGIVKQYKDLDGIAADFKIPTDELKKTVAKFNDAVKSKKDPEFGRYINNEQKPLTEGPWYAAEMSPKVHHCMGGLYTNIDCQVIDIVTDKPIPGLYAAGEATAGVHGAVRLGSCAILDCLVNGRIAGQKAAKA
mgnify:CR=1 FL=1